MALSLSLNLWIIPPSQVNCVNFKRTYFKKYKNEQNAALIEKEQKIDQERNELAAQKLEAAKMLEELAALKAQLASAGAIATPASESPVAENVEAVASENSENTEVSAMDQGESVDSEPIGETTDKA